MYEYALVSMTLREQIEHTTHDTSNDRAEQAVEGNSGKEDADLEYRRDDVKDIELLICRVRLEAP